MMISNRRWAYLVVVFSTIAGASSLTWAAHGHGGGHGGVGHSQSGGFSHSGGHGHVSYGHYGGYGGSRNYWGGNSRYYSGYSGYRNYYRPYIYGYFGFPFLNGYYNYPGYYGYPSYYYNDPSDYYANDYYYGDTAPAQEYVVSRPVSDVAQVQFRLPDPQATLWVQGKEMVSSGTVRQFKSPQLDPSQQYTYNVKAQWNDNGKLVADERQVKVRANQLSLVDFTQPSQATSAAGRPPQPDLPPPHPPVPEQ